MAGPDLAPPPPAPTRSQLVNNTLSKSGQDANEDSSAAGMAARYGGQGAYGGGSYAGGGGEMGFNGGSPQYGGVMPQRQWAYNQYLNHLIGTTRTNAQGKAIGGDYAGKTREEMIDASRDQWAKMSPEDRAPWLARVQEHDVHTDTDAAGNSTQGFDTDNQRETYGNKGQRLIGGQQTAPTYPAGQAAPPAQAAPTQVPPVSSSVGAPTPPTPGNPSTPAPAPTQSLEAPQGQRMGMTVSAPENAPSDQSKPPVYAGTKDNPINFHGGQPDANGGRVVGATPAQQFQFNPAPAPVQGGTLNGQNPNDMVAGLKAKNQATDLAMGKTPVPTIGGGPAPELRMTAGLRPPFSPPTSASAAPAASTASTPSPSVINHPDATPGSSSSPISNSESAPAPPTPSSSPAVGGTVPTANPDVQTPISYGAHVAFDKANEMTNKVATTALDAGKSALGMAGSAADATIGGIKNTADYLTRPVNAPPTSAPSFTKSSVFPSTPGMAATNTSNPGGWARANDTGEETEEQKQARMAKTNQPKQSPQYKNSAAQPTPPPAKQLVTS